MEELKERKVKREGRHRDTWDPFQLNPVGAEKESKQICFKLAQYLVAVIVGLAVLTAAVVAKGSLLVLTTLSGQKSMRSKKEKQFYMLMLVFCLVCPNLLVFLKCLWRIAFKSFEKPNMKTMLFVCVIECLVSLGTSLLVLVVMPEFDVLTNLFISGGVCIVSAILQIAFRLQKETWRIVFPLCSLMLTVVGYFLLVMDYYVRYDSHVDRETAHCFPFVALGIFASLLVSLCWWENPLQATNRLQDTLSELDGFRDFVFVISSVLRVIVIGNYLPSTSASTHSRQKNNKITHAHDMYYQHPTSLCFAFCSAACHWFGVVACKIHAVRMSFALPVCCTGPAVLLVGLILFTSMAQTLEGNKLMNITSEFTYISIAVFCDSLKHVDNPNVSIALLEVTNSMCQTSLNSHYLQWPFSMLALEGVCMWSGFVTCTYYVWKIKVSRIERTSQLFVRRLYESAFIDLSLLLNTKMKVAHDEIQNCVIYLCATMWHETYDEMLKILTSMFRLDRYRGDPKEEHNDFFNFECHIYVDDAFMDEELPKEKRLVNSYVEDLIKVVLEVYRVFTNKEPDDVSIIEAPYGGRLMFVMPEGNMLYVHLKDKQRIRNKKRWSQIMYLYYLLGWKGYIVKNPQKINTRRQSLISTDGEIFLMPQFENDNKRKFISDDNTYILALDGDTDFQPKAVILLVDRLRMYDNVGAACGRIHPTGMGPMVWYQKFEYAVGHWLQKTAEHVFGSVLCSPGCFSLFRGSALMDDNVLKRYTTTATRGSEYVQYDQGEDRWLCTLLLQQGWRVEYNAASDAYTNSPQEFKEFYNQRRRWGPSTLANTLDLLHSGAETVKRNTSISRLYIFYQMFTVGSSILGPASVTLMIAGAFQFIFKMAGTLSIIIACIPPTLYIIICFVTKANTQITIAGIMSVLYAFLMTASLFSIIGAYTTPTGNFGYLLLTIYSLVNMNNVSWGTRESNKTEGEQKKQHSTVCDQTCKICCWDLKIQWMGGNLQAQIRYTLRNKNEDDVCEELVLMLTDTLNGELSSVGPEDVLSDADLDQLQYALARQTLKTNGMQKLERRVKRAIEKTLAAPQVQRLDERDFWDKLIERYLHPIVNTKQHEEDVKKELKSLRNKAVFLYFIINVLWVVATFFLQAIGNDIISIEIPKYYPNGTLSGEPLRVEPLSLMFLLSFAILLVVQFLAMLYHRVYTLIHVVSYRGSEKDYRKTEDVSNNTQTHTHTHKIKSA
uniref:chitin synthase n=1 Tax=Stegastes partitus TaxID=144197 RepID=A0A3B5AI74_9TELE